MVEVASVDTNPSKLPEVEPIQAGKIDATTTRCFDLFCVGKYELGSDLKLNIQSAKKIPNLVTKDANGNLVFAEPEPVCTIRGPRGHNVWVNIELKTVTTEVPKYMCLGIRKRGEEGYYDILCTGNLSRYVDVLETDTVELVPLISSTELPTYTPTKVGDTAKVNGDNTYDFGSVYRVNITPYEGQWLTEQKCNLNEICRFWTAIGTLSVGDIVGQDGQIHHDQLVILASTGQIAYSSNGIYWFETNSICEQEKSWVNRLAFGNNIWCTIDFDSGVYRSIDYGKSWSSTAEIKAHILSFANGVFMAITNAGGVYTSSDAEHWTLVGSTPNMGEGNDATTYKILIYGNGKWICGTRSGQMYYSKDGKGNWIHINSNLSSNLFLYGGCFVNGYFYIVNHDGAVKKSIDGENWINGTSLDISVKSGKAYNVSYYKNKIYVFKQDGTSYSAGLFTPGGTI